MKKITVFIVLCLLLLLNFSYAGGGDENIKFSKSKNYSSFARFNINNISTWIYNDGVSDISLVGNSGFEYPKGTGKTAIYQSGFLWGGKVNGEIRVGGSAYRSGLKPGRIQNSGVPWQQLQAENPEHPGVRVYRVRPDYNRGFFISELADGEGTYQEIMEKYQKDWDEWPSQFGAPFYDVDNDGVYNPEIDIPGVPGSNQTIWFVANDVDSIQTKFLYGSLPLGIEMQVTIWGYRSNKSIDNIIFKKYRLINKSNNEITDMYTSIWNDPDLGDASDDYVGCDTLSGLGYVYNAHSFDHVYGSYPPAVGINLLQGPIVNGLPSDSAIFNGRIVRDRKNLPMTAHYFYIGPDAVYRDPTQGQYHGTLELYNFLQGRVGTTGAIFPIPLQLGGGTTVYPLSGDPVTGEGWIDGILHPPGDRRNGISSGPFNFAAGDTQEVVFAQVASVGSENYNNLTAINSLKQLVEFSQFLYNSFFSFPFVLNSPQPVAGEFDREIILNWGRDLQSMQAIENFEYAGYKFQGYNVYQLPSENASIEDAIRIATFDIKDGVKVILDDEYDPETGAVERRVQQIGSDSGLERFIRIDRDHIKNQLLNNGSVYYFAVTAYTYNPSLLGLNNFESELKIIKTVPQSTPPGIRYEGKFGDKIEIIHESGESDGEVEAEVIDPSKLNGHSYNISFVQNELETIWHLTDVTEETETMTNDVKTIDEGEYVIIDGLKLFVANQRYGLKKDDIANAPDNPELWGWETISGMRRFTWQNADKFKFEGFRGAIGYNNPYSFFNSKPNLISPDNLKKVLIIFGNVSDTTSFENPNINPDNPSTDINFSYAYRYGIGFENFPAKPEFIPYIINQDSGFSFQDFKKCVPLSVWDINDPENPRRLAVGFTENNVENSLLDGRYFPGDFNQLDDNTSENGPSEWLFIFDTDYTEQPDPVFQINILNNPVPIMYWLTVNRFGAVPFSPNVTGEDQFAIYPYKVFTNDDKYSFTAPKIIRSEELAKEDVRKINVFPNPYYGTSPQEASRHETFVTFNHLPQKATIRIFNLAGQLVRTIHKDSPEQFEIWDLRNEHSVPAASGVFIIFIEMPYLQETKILKLAIIQREAIP